MWASKDLKMAVSVHAFSKNSYITGLSGAHKSYAGHTNFYTT